MAVFLKGSDGATIELEPVSDQVGSQGHKYKYVRVDDFYIGHVATGLQTNGASDAIAANVDDENPRSDVRTSCDDAGVAGDEKYGAKVGTKPAEGAGEGTDKAFIPLAKPSDRSGAASAAPKASVPPAGKEHVVISDDDDDDDGSTSTSSSCYETMPDGVSLPWEAACRRIHSPLLRLHQEIVSFADFVKPTPEEQSIREAAVDRVRRVILGIWPQARAEVFGSFRTGLYLPTSDVDMVVLDSGARNIPRALDDLKRAISRKGLGRNLLALPKAKVPIIKFVEVETKLNFDISFNVANGVKTVAFIKDMLEELPQLRPLLMVIKIFLQQRELNEVYSGGVGSYALIIMVSVFLETHASRHGRDGPSEPEQCLGVLLVDFFDFYGNILNYHEVGISCRGGGSFYRKRQLGFYSSDRPYLLSIEDPGDVKSDVGKNSFSIIKVKNAFQFAHTILMSPSDDPHRELLLMRIIRMDAIMIKRMARVAKHPKPLHNNRGNRHNKHNKVSKANEANKGNRAPDKKRPRETKPSEAPPVRALSQKEKDALMGVTTISSDDSSGMDEGYPSDTQDGEDGPSGSTKRARV